MTPPAGNDAPLSCPFCGAAVSSVTTSCTSCPMNTGCGSLCCPRCGYRFVERSAVWDGVAGLLRRITGRATKPAVSGS